MGGVELAVFHSFLLGELSSVFWWVELNLFSLKCSEVSNTEFWSAYGLACLWTVCLLFIIYCLIVFLFGFRIIMVCPALELVDFWLELGFSASGDFF